MLNGLTGELWMRTMNGCLSLISSIVKMLLRILTILWLCRRQLNSTRVFGHEGVRLEQQTKSASQCALSRCAVVEQAALVTGD